MKKLYLSLIAGALISSFILGWLIDSFSTHDSDDFAFQKQLLSGFAKQVAVAPSAYRHALVEQAAEDFALALSYQSNSELALPQELLSQLMSEQGLVIEGESDYSILKSHPEFSDHHILLIVNKRNEANHKGDLFLTVGFYLGICIFMWVWLSPLTQRLSLLNQMALRFANGDLDARIAPNKLTYIKGVEVAFNRMANQIQKLLEENKLLASSLSHDIRTPVACLRFGLDAALDSESNEQKDAYLARMEQDLDHMECMLTHYLEFATLEHKAAKITSTCINVQTLLESCVHQIEPKLAAQNKHITVKSQSVLLECDPHWLARALTNLLTNAADFAKTQILITVTQTANDTFIEVEDDGCGIAKEHRDKILKPFYQQETHRNRAGKNYGLGLAIVAKVVDWHFGDIQVNQSSELGGAKFTIRLPRQQIRTVINH